MRAPRSYRTVISSILLGILAIAVIGFLVISNLRINQRRAELTTRIEAFKKEIQILEEKNQELQSGIIRSGEEDFLEEKAREQLGLKKPGEEVVVILPPEEIQPEPIKEKNFWQKFLDPVRNFFGDL